MRGPFRSRKFSVAYFFEYIDCAHIVTTDKIANRLYTRWILPEPSTQAASPIVWRWRVCAWLGRCSDMGNGGGLSRWRPWWPEGWFWFWNSHKIAWDFLHRNSIQVCVCRKKSEWRFKTQIKLVANCKYLWFSIHRITTYVGWSANGEDESYIGVHFLVYCLGKQHVA